MKKNKKSLTRSLAVLLTATMLSVTVPGFYLSALAAEDISVQEDVTEENFTEAGEDAEYAEEDTAEVEASTEDAVEDAENASEGIADEDEAAENANENTADADETTKDAVEVAENADKNTADAVEDTEDADENTADADEAKEDAGEDADENTADAVEDAEDVEDNAENEEENETADPLADEILTEDGILVEEAETAANAANASMSSLNDAVISGIKNVTYTGYENTFDITVKVGNVPLLFGTDYVISYSNNVEIGEASVTITGRGNYEGSVTKKFLILPGTSKKLTCKNVKTGIKLSWEKVDGANYYHVYRGSKFLVTTSKLEMTDQEVVNNIGKKYTYKVYASKNKIWDGPTARTATMYRLRPVGIKSLTSTEPGRMTLKYENGEICTGYVVRFGLNSNMSDAKVITVSGADTTQKTFSNLSKEKKYYVQVRTYKLENGTRYYSAYSTTKTVTIMGDQQAANIPMIAMTYVPKYGVNKAIEGTVFMKDGSTLNASDYKISIFIQVVAGGYHWPKPYFDSRATKINSDGSFKGYFVTGGDDISAITIHVLLLKSSVTIGEFDETLPKAIDYVKIQRTKDGGITISPMQVASTAIKSVTNSAAGKISITYNKSVNASGYIIRYGLMSNMSDAKTITVSGAGTTSATISGLTKGQTYYVQVRATLLKDGTRYYSDFSAKKSIKITK